MRIITDSPITNDDAYSNAKGDGKARRAARKSKRSGRQKSFGDKGMTNKEFRQSQKEGRKALKGGSKEEKKAARQARRSERKTRRKARRNARKLSMDTNKDGKVTFKDLIHPLKRKKNASTGQASWVKVNPDGSEEIVPDDKVEEVKGNGGVKVPVAEEDLVGVENAQANPDGTVIAEIPEENVEEMTFDDGSTGYGKKADVEGGENDKGMSKKLKTGLIIGGIVLVVGVVATILIVQARKKKKGAKPSKK
jgi:hypothetical protein